jgi:hypothetical protein
MSRPPKHALQTVEDTEETAEPSDQREVYLRDGRKLVVSEQSAGSLVEIRSESGLVEVRIQLTEEGPVLQMESARLQLKADEAIEISSKRVAIAATEELALTAGAVDIEAETGVDVEAKEGDVKVVGKMIYLN